MWCGALQHLHRYKGEGWRAGYAIGCWILRYWRYISHLALAPLQRGGDMRPRLPVFWSGLLVNYRFCPAELPPVVCADVNDGVGLHRVGNEWVYDQLNTAPEHNATKRFGIGPRFSQLLALH
eukprot:1569228-Pyramimonas_sp.AAC.1